VRILKFSLLAVTLSGCAVLHRAQYGDVDATHKKAKKISVKVSENTINIGELSSVAGAIGKKSKGVGKLGEAFDWYETLFQFGPRTGTPVFTENYARGVPAQLAEKCPKGRLVNIVSLRESREYPVVKGEIVRVDADCIGGG